MRLNVTADGVLCFATRCMEPDRALRQLADALAREDGRVDGRVAAGARRFPGDEKPRA